MNDRTITCVQCERSFPFTAAEQERFVAFGFDPPRRCPECRRRKSGVDRPHQKWKARGKRRQDKSATQYRGIEW